MSEPKPKLRYLGLSSDGRANRWRVTCPYCSAEFEPLTTRMARQQLTCPKPKCGKEMAADYNAALDELEAQDKAK